MGGLNEKPLLILGGGLMGLAIAHELAQRGKHVEVLSRSRNEAAGFVAAGMLAPHAEGLQGNLLNLGQTSLRRHPAWIKSIESNSKMSCGLKTCGIVVPFENQKECESYPTYKFGEKLKKNELLREVPGLSEKWKAGLLFRQDGQIDNRRLLMRALEKACVELGVHFQEGVEVIEILKESGAFHGVKIKDINGNIKHLKSEKGVLCCGAWSKQIFKTLPIFPVKGQMLSIQGPKQILKRIVFGPGIYLVPRDDGLIIVGATSEREAGFQKGLTPKGQSDLKKGIQSLIPELNQLPHMERWWGFRPCTPDEEPLMGMSSINGLWLATGHHRNGVLLAAITSELIGKSICSIPLNNEESTFMSQFSWDRF
ncbi:glycine oxidase ThiO [Prochlorococcus sp. MIT 0801]|uniref:glycine oxidase ThiO n=1 Tax=Prochlorococcus sp. MIT 0801 TaxID=1501269 RepID=UPI0004F6A105|nr:glycine oxidase ThiO [Prochlorococcus sp. MIT 0801]AIQ96156.1 Glycine oxidase ThiO [Prochlorococcus sp. MIT 0801]